MSPIYIALLANAGLLAVLILLQPLWRDIKQGIAYTLSSFDDKRDEGVFANRLNMVVRNQIEAIGLLVPILIIALHAGVETTWLAYGIYAQVAGRILYALVSLGGVPIARSAMWTLGLAGTAIVAFQTIGPLS